MSKIYKFRFARVKALSDLSLAIQLGERALEHSPTGHAKRSMALGNLAQLHTARFHKLRDIKDIDKAVDYASESLETNGDPEDYGAICMDISNALGSRFEMFECADDCAKAICFARQAVEVTPEEDEELLADRCHNLSTLLGDRFGRFSNGDDLEEAIRLEERVITTIKHDEYRLARASDHLGELLDSKSHFRQDASYLNQAIQLASDAINHTSGEEDEDHALYFYHMALRLSSRYGFFGNFDDLQNAIKMMEKSRHAMTDDDLDLLEMTIDFSDLLHTRYLYLGLSDDIALGVTLTQWILDDKYTERPMKQEDLCKLSRHCCDRYEMTRSLEDIETSIRLAEKAVNLADVDHPYRPYSLLQLSHALQTRFEALGSLPCLERSISIIRQSLDSVPDDEAATANLQYDLSQQILRRYEQFGSLDDLEQSLYLMQACKKNPSTNPQNHMICLYTLGVGQSYCFDRSNDVSDLERGIDFINQALVLAPSHGLTKATALQCLGMLHESRFKIANSLGDLQRAVEVAREALQEVPEDYPGRNIFLSSLGDLLCLYPMTGESFHIQEAVEVHSRALNMTAKSHTNRAMYLINMAKVMIQAGESEFESQSPLDLFIQALNHLKSPPLDRIIAGRKAFDIYIAAQKWDCAVLVARMVIKLFPLFLPRWLSRDDQQHALKNITSFTSQAASAVLHAGRTPEEALQTLEAGRGVISGLSIELKTDISKLERHKPLLHAEYIQLRRQVLLNFSRSSWGFKKLQNKARRSHILFPTTGTDRMEVMQGLEELESKIRAEPGFQDFCRPSSAKTYLRLASNGPIVAFNVTRLRSDALIVTDKHIESLRLDELYYDALEAKVKRVIGEDRLSRGLLSTRSVRNQELREILEWLWEVAVGPVLDRLGLIPSHQPIKPLPRICWVTSGHMGLLPLHAAGNETHNAMDYAISSYTPTFETLDFCLKRVELVSCHQDLRVLIVTAPTKKNHIALKTTEELGWIKKGLPNNTSVTILHEKPCKTVLEELPKHDLIHFSCHGKSNAIDPSASTLELSSHSDLQESFQLKVRDLASVDHSRAQIAYLSACSTAENSSGELLDETIHIASAFQLAGFPHVIGTVWEASDKAAIEVSRQFYEVLGQQLRNQGHLGDVAYALHQAIQALRKKKPENFLSWSPFIYLGA